MNKEFGERAAEAEINPAESRQGLWMLLGVIALITGAFVFLRTEPSDVGNAEELARIVTAGQPTVIDFYSDF